jgi:hypothetical protein
VLKKLRQHDIVRAQHDLSLTSQRPQHVYEANDVDVVHTLDRIVEHGEAQTIVLFKVEREEQTDGERVELRGAEDLHSVTVTLAVVVVHPRTQVSDVADPVRPEGEVPECGMHVEAPEQRVSEGSGAAHDLRGDVGDLPADPATDGLSPRRSQLEAALASSICDSRCLSCPARISTVAASCVICSRYRRLVARVSCKSRARRRRPVCARGARGCAQLSVPPRRLDNAQRAARSRAPQAAAPQQLAEVEADPFLVLSLCDLYAEVGAWGAIVDVAAGTANEDDVSLQVRLYQARALQEQGMRDAALQAYKDALRSQKRHRDLLRKARYGRAWLLLDTGNKAQARARKELEKVYAVGPGYRDLRDLLESLGGGSG